MIVDFVFSITVKNIYAINRSVEEDNLLREVGNANLMMHASGVHNVVGILSR